MSTFIQAIIIMFSWLPSWFVTVVLAFLALSLIIVVIKVVGLILEALPFL